MKREQRILAITGNKEVVVSVLYRGRLWFEGVDVKLLRRETSIEDVLETKYLNQARTILIDEELLRSYSSDLERVLATLKSMERKVNVVVVKRGEEFKKVSSQSDAWEALRVARKIFYEIQSVIQKVS